MLVFFLLHYRYFLFNSIFSSFKSKYLFYNMYFDQVIDSAHSGGWFLLNYLPHTALHFTDSLQPAVMQGLHCRQFFRLGVVHQGWSVPQLSIACWGTPPPCWAEASPLPLTTIWARKLLKMTGKRDKSLARMTDFTEKTTDYENQAGCQPFKRVPKQSSQSIVFENSFKILREG